MVSMVGWGVASRLQVPRPAAQARLGNIPPWGCLLPSQHRSPGQDALAGWIMVCVGSLCCLERQPRPSLSFSAWERGCGGHGGGERGSVKAVTSPQPAR